MKILLSILLTLSVFLTVSAQTLGEYQLQVGEFTKIKVPDRVDVIYRNVPDSAGMVAYKATPRHAEAYSFSVKKGTLRVNLEQEWEEGMPTVYVYSSFLSGVENEGDGTVTVYSPAPCPEFEARLIGNGTIMVDNINTTQTSATLMTGNGLITITGATGEASASMMGAGRIDLSCLSATDVSCKAVGSGWISCWARKKLSVKGIGSTKIYYRGEPEISRMGGAKVLPISEMEN